MPTPKLVPDLGEVWPARFDDGSRAGFRTFSSGSSGNTPTIQVNIVGDGIPYKIRYLGGDPVCSP